MKKDTYFLRVKEQTATRFWINNVTRKEADLSIEHGAVGCTQNPSYTAKMLMSEEEKEYSIGILKNILKDTNDCEVALDFLQRELVRPIAKKFLPLFEQSGGRNGYVSIQATPLREDTDTIIKAAKFNCEAGENIMAKIPATKEGLEAMEELIPLGIPINATEVMTVRQVMDVCQVYNKTARKMKNPPVLYYSHITGILDEYLQKYVAEKNINISKDILYQAGMLAAHKSYRISKSIAPEVGFIGGGARGIHHFTEMVGADACITINWVGMADKLIEINPTIIDRVNKMQPDLVLDELLEKVDEFKRAWQINAITPDEYEDYGPVVLFRTMFVNAWNDALGIIKEVMNDK